ncbi:hypothetical protein CR513_02297, partial [Mucuna pruriens]
MTQILPVLSEENSGAYCGASWLLAVASLQARNEEQSKLSAEAEQRQMEAKERHRMVEERYKEMLRMAEEREEELWRQLAVVKATIEKPAGSLPTVSLPTFWAQPFSKEID